MALPRPRKAHRIRPARTAEATGVWREFLQSRRSLVCARPPLKMAGVCRDPLPAARMKARGPMSFYPHGPDRPTFSVLSRAFAYCPNARFTGLLAPAFFQSVAQSFAVRFGSGAGDTFDPAVTLWAWLSQALSPAKSCVAAVSRVMALCCGLGLAISCAATGASCKARAKLPEAFLRHLAACLGRRIE